MNKIFHENGDSYSVHLIATTFPILPYCLTPHSDAHFGYNLCSAHDDMWLSNGEVGEYIASWNDVHNN